MGAKTWMAVITNGGANQILASNPVLDRAETNRVAALLFPKEKLKPLEDGCLTWTCPEDDEICIGCFPQLTIIAAKEFAIDYPSQIPQRFLEYAGTGTLQTHAMHSVVDWFAFSIWRNGKLERALSLSPDSGILENTGKHLAFEEAFWSGDHPAIDIDDIDPDEPVYPFPFHPLELGEAALRELFGYQLEGYVDPTLIDTDSISLLRFKRKKLLFGFL